MPTEIASYSKTLRRGWKGVRLTPLLGVLYQVPLFLEFPCQKQHQRFSYRGYCKNLCADDCIADCSFCYLLIAEIVVISCFVFYLAVYRLGRVESRFLSFLFFICCIPDGALTTALVSGGGCIYRTPPSMRQRPEWEEIGADVTALLSEHVLPNTKAYLVRRRRKGALTKYMGRRERASPTCPG